MKKFGKKTEKTSAGASSVVKKVITLILCFFCSVFLTAETYALLTHIIPYVSIVMFQATGISVAEGLTFAEFSVGDTIVLCMMWLLPCLCGIAMVSAAQWKLICFVVRKMARMIRNAFFCRSVPAEENQTETKEKSI